MDEPVGEVMDELHATLVEATDVQDVLTAVAHACDALLGGREAETTVTLRREGEASAVAWTGERARRCDEVEYASGEGPCLTSLDVGGTILVPDIARDERWPAWRDAALEAGFAASAAFPVQVAPGVGLSLDVYSEVHGVFDEASVAGGQRLAKELGHVLRYSLRLVDLATTTADLRAALESRAVIDQAIGMVMAQNRCSADEALALLRRASQGRNVKLRDLAYDMVRRVGGAEPPEATFEPRNG